MAQCHSRTSTSFIKLSPLPPPNGGAETPPAAETTPTRSLASLVASLEAAHASSTAALDSTDTPPEEGELDELDLERMLARLDEAEGAADELEGKLDGLLGNLDQMLSLLGVNPTDLEGDGDSESQEEEEASIKGETQEGSVKDSGESKAETTEDKDR
ncbi:hypothetical protein JCM3766R1_005194 [Sporobolomyces carnicolor]